VSVLVASDLTKVFGDPPAAFTAVEAASLSVGEGEVVLLLGPSGSGKTTLLSMLAGLLRPTRGQVTLDGQMIDAKAGSTPALRLRSVGFVFQSFNLLATLSALDNVALPLRLAGVSRRVATQRAAEMLDAVGLASRAGLTPKVLSGGEKQRVSIARALVHHPRVVLADEPTASLDTHQGRIAVELLTSVARQGRQACLIVTHDPRLTSYADRVLAIEDGRLTQSGGGGA
jgi:putative ABC transport system ATP-binding protein